MSKSKVLVGVIIIIIIVVLGAGGWLIYANYSSNHPTPSKIQVSENQQNITLKKNQELTIVLSSNATTGYSWQLNNSYDKNIVNFINTDYVNSSSGLMGAPGQELWNFKGINKGSTTLGFTYSQKWLKNILPANTKTFNITVQ